MIKILKEKMSELDYKQFIEDYNKLYDYKSNKALWKKAMSTKNGEVPFLKDIFDSIGTPFNYLRYKDKTSNNRELTPIIFGRYNKERNSEEIIECLLYHYSTETYIGFIVEVLIYEELKKHTKRVYKNNVLDTKKKADIMLNGVYYQIKNSSFIFISDNTQKMIDYYKSKNDRLHFIFYTIEKDNIYICAVGGKPYLFIDEIDNFTFARGSQNITLQSLINTMLAEF